MILVNGEAKKLFQGAKLAIYMCVVSLTMSKYIQLNLIKIKYN